MIILTALFYLLPAYIANMFPVITGKIPGPKWIIQERWFGSHKTWRGFLAAYLGGVLTIWGQTYLVQHFEFWQNLSLLNYAQISIWKWGFLFGIGALTGDLVKSFVKRRLNKPSGSPWFPWDQIDLVLGAIIFTYPFYQLELKHLIILIIITPLLHFLTNVIAYFIGLKKVWW